MLIFYHNKYWNYPYEWSFNMLKDAAPVLLEVNNIANQFGFELIDTHFNNIVFDRTKPKYFDLGGFEVIKDKSIWKGYIGFYDHFYATLFLWSRGYVNTARNITLMNICFSQEEFFKIKHPIIYTKTINKVLQNIRRLGMSSSHIIESKFKSIIIKKILFIIKKIIQSRFTGSALEDKVKTICPSGTFTRIFESEFGSFTFIQHPLIGQTSIISPVTNTSSPKYLLGELSK